MLIFLPSQSGLSCKLMSELLRTLMENLLQLDLYVKVLYEFVPFGSPADVYRPSILVRCISFVPFHPHCLVDIKFNTSSCIQSESERVSVSVVSDSLQPHGLQPTRLLSPWNSPSKNTRVGCHSFFPGDRPVISSQMFLFGPTGPFIELQTQGTLQRVLVSLPLLMAAPSAGMLSSLLLICPNSTHLSGQPEFYLLYKVLPGHPNLK